MSDGLGEIEIDHDKERRLQEAEARIEALAQDYEAWAMEDLNEAKHALIAAKEKPSDRQPQIQKIFNIAHNMKGQGGTFGYELVTLVGQSLCDFIRHIPDATDAELKVIDRHLSVITMILEQKIKGSGGQFANKLVEKLKYVVAAVQGELIS